MRSPVIVAVDVGTSWVKAILAARDGRTLGTSRTPLGLAVASDGAATQDPDEAMAAVAASVRSAMDGHRGRVDVAAISVTGQMGGVMLVRPDGTHQTPWYSALDERARTAAEDLEQEAGDLIRSLNGAAPFMAARLRWLVDSGINCVGLRPSLLTSYVLAVLCDSMEALVVDRTSLTWTGLADVRAGGWSEDLAHHARCSPADLPAVVEPGTCVGRLSDSASTALGLLAGTPVYSSAGDQAAALYAAGVRNPGQSADIAATYPILGTATGEFRPPRRRGIDVMAGVERGTWYVLGYLLGVGRLPVWWSDRFWPQHPGDPVDFEAAAASIEPGSGGLIVAPHLSGESGGARSGRRAGMTGLTWSTTPAHVYRAVLEAIAFEYRILARSLAEEGAPLGQPLRSLGGGAGIRLLCSIKADVLGLDIERIPHVDLTLLGAASLLSSALGWEGHIDQPPIETVSWSPDRHRAYERLADLYEETLADWPAPAPTPATPSVAGEDGRCVDLITRREPVVPPPDRSPDLR